MICGWPFLFFHALERNEAFASLRLRWGPAQNAIITALYDQEYMAAVRVKLDIIKALKAAL